MGGVKGSETYSAARSLRSGGLVAYPLAFRFHLWLVSQAESNEIEGEHETAEGLRDLAALALEWPAALEAYLVLREQGKEPRS